VSYYLQRKCDDFLYFLGAEPNAWTAVFSRVGPFIPVRWVGIAAAVRLEMSPSAAHAEHVFVGQIAKDIVGWARGETVELMLGGVSVDIDRITGSRFSESARSW
jgi:hypothetical protein